MSRVWIDRETGEAFDPDSRCSWCRKSTRHPTRLVWVKWNSEYQWVCEHCAANLGASDG